MKTKISTLKAKRNNNRFAELNTRVSHLETNLHLALGQIDAIKVDPELSNTARISRLESQILALQLVIRELTGYTDAVGDDVTELQDELFGDDGGDDGTTEANG